MHFLMHLFAKVVLQDQLLLDKMFTFMNNNLINFTNFNRHSFRFLETLTNIQNDENE